MSEENLLDEVIDDVKNEDGKLPQMLNVLTILTFIGSGLGVLGGLLLLVGSGAVAAYLPGAQGGGSVLVIGIITLLTSAACIYGAIQMRKLNKQGFFIYVAGVAIALIAGIALSGFNVMSLVWSGLFIGLYASQSKHLK
jgi:hypothetical protein